MAVGSANRVRREKGLAARALRETWRAEVRGRALRDAVRTIGCFAACSPAREVGEEERFAAALRDLADARSFALMLEGHETGSGLRRGDSLVIVAAGQIAFDLTAGIEGAGGAAALRVGDPWREVGLRETFRPDLGAGVRATLRRLLDLLYREGLEEGPARARARKRRSEGSAAGEREQPRSLLREMLRGLGGELGFLADVLHRLTLPAATGLALAVERSARSAAKAVAGEGVFDVYRSTGDAGPPVR